MNEHNRTNEMICESSKVLPKEVSFLSFNSNSFMCDPSRLVIPIIAFFSIFLSKEQQHNTQTLADYFQYTTDIGRIA